MAKKRSKTVPVQVAQTVQQRRRRQAMGNPIAENPLLRKGGAHEKSKSAKRQQAKRNLQQQVRAEPQCCCA